MKQKKVEADAEKLLVIYINQTFEEKLKDDTGKGIDCSIRNAFIQFLIEVMKAQNLAISELLLTEKSNHTLIQQFHIFRMKGRIEGELNNKNFTEGNEAEKNNSKDKVEMVMVMAYENAFQHFKAALIKVCYLHLQFWLNLEDDSPGTKLFIN